jgi:hypothetical protein
MMVLIAPQRLAAHWGARQQRLANGAAQLAAAREELVLIKVRARQAIATTGTEVHSMFDRAAHRTTMKKAVAAWARRPSLNWTRRRMPLVSTVRRSAMRGGVSGCPPTPPPLRYRILLLTEPCSSDVRMPHFGNCTRPFSK